LQLEDLRRQRELLTRNGEQVERHLREIDMAHRLPGPLTLVSTGDLSGPPTDPRPRRAAWGAAGGFVAFFVLRGLWRRWRERRRVVLARTAFPVITHHEPKPVVLIEDATEPAAG
jgi:hypothetical protein